MNRKNFLKLISSSVLITVIGNTNAMNGIGRKLKIRLLRHATLLIEINGINILVDPFLAEKDTYDPVRWTSNGIRVPMVELPIDKNELQHIIAQTNAVLVTHTHRDHWDDKAKVLIPKNTTIIGQPEDEEKFKAQGFESVIAVKNSYTHEGITITRVNAQHGSGEMAKKMAPVSGYILDDGSQKIYITGDTIWCEDVKETIVRYQPNFIILNAGAAQFDIDSPITMTTEDILKVCEHSKAKKIICVHMETMNHCYLKRTDLRNALRHKGEDIRCTVPDDGETIRLV